MSAEIDLNKIAVDFVNQNIERFYNTGKEVFKGAADSIRLRLNRSYKAYLSCVIGRYSLAKTFFIRDEPTYLYDFYVPLGLSCGNKTVKRASLAEILKINSQVVITGEAGSGKSLLMRHLFLIGVTQLRKNIVKLNCECSKVQ